MGGSSRKTGGVKGGKGGAGGGSKPLSSQGKSAGSVKTGSGKTIKNNGTYTTKIGGKSKTFKGVKVRKINGKIRVFLTPGGRGTDPRNL